MWYMERRFLHLILIFIILLGFFVRFSGIDQHYLNGDEEFYIVGAEKFHAGSDYDVRLWNYHAPPVAKWLMSLALIGTATDYSIAYAIPANLWVWNYIAADSIKEAYPLIRTMSAIFGTLFVVLIFISARELFGTTKGLWAAASAAIAIDYIILSRVALIDIYLYAFIAATMYFFIMYRKTKKAPWLAGLFASMIMMFGSKNVQWLVIIPPMLYVELIGNKRHIGKTIHFLIILGIAWFIHSSFIYPPEFSSAAAEFFTSGANKNIIEPHFDKVFLSLVSINSYFFLITFFTTIGMLLVGIGVHKRRIDWEKIRKHITYPTPYTFLLLFAFMSLVMFTLTSLSLNSKYIGQISIPFFVLGGLAVGSITAKKKILLPVFLGLLIIGAAGAVFYGPSYERYPGQQVISFSSPGREANQLLSFLEKQGNPPVITNSINLLIFYSGQSIPLPIRDSAGCTTNLVDQLRAAGAVGVFKNIGTVERNFVCDLVLDDQDVLKINPEGEEPQGIVTVRYY